MAKFDMGEFTKTLMENVSKLDTGNREQIEYIDVDLIDDDPRNFYELTGLDELAANIELCGLQQPIRVRSGSGDHVVIVSGHRRKAAIRKLVEDGRDDLREIACIRERNEDSEELQELRLIYANSDTREKSPAEKAKEVERSEILLYQLKQKGFEFPGRLRDHVAAVCKISASKLARLKVIREGLKGKWAGLFQEDKLSEQTAYALARMPEDLQERLAKVCQNPPLGYAAEQILSLYEAGATWEPNMQCPDGRICKRGDAFLRHDVEHCHDTCMGEKCCLDCSRAKDAYYPCDRMCSKAQALRKEKRDDLKAEQAKAEEKRQRGYQRIVQKSAMRLLRAADAAGLEDKERFTIQSHRGSFSVGDLRSFAAGDFQGKYFYENDMCPAKAERLDQLAQFFHCSSDYLLGLTEDLNPVPKPPAEGWVPLEWIPGREQPKKPGQQAVAKFRVDDKDRPRRMIAEWDGSRWRFPNGGATIDAECVFWFPIPGEEGDGCEADSV